MKVIMQRTYRPMDAEEGVYLNIGDEADLPNDEANRAIEAGIAKTPEDAAKSPEEAAAIELLASLGYTVTAPKTPPMTAPKPAAPAFPVQ